MKHFEEIQVPAHTDKAFRKMTCDICGRETKHETNWLADSEADLSETRIEIKTGYSPPDHWGDEARGEKQFFEICPQCFIGKLVPWLESQGAKIQTTSWVG